MKLLEKLLHAVYGTDIAYLTNGAGFVFQYVLHCLDDQLTLNAIFCSHFELEIKTCASVSILYQEGSHRQLDRFIELGMEENNIFSSQKWILNELLAICG